MCSMDQKYIPQVKFLKCFREILGYTQEDLARSLHVSKSLISSLETGRRSLRCHHYLISYKMEEAKGLCAIGIISPQELNELEDFYSLYLNSLEMSR